MEKEFSPVYLMHTQGNLPIMELGLSHTALGTCTPRQLSASFLDQSEEWRYFDHEDIWFHF